MKINSNPPKYKLPYDDENLGEALKDFKIILYRDKTYDNDDLKEKIGKILLLRRYGK